MVNILLSRNEAKMKKKWEDCVGIPQGDACHHLLLGKNFSNPMIMNPIPIKYCSKLGRRKNSMPKTIITTPIKISFVSKGIILNSTHTYSDA
ncbi:MAG: hypothetical protein WED04_11455 [Promethearchaeati archaeon SRVP18_Atabeyarchaeia-1]